MWGRVCCGLPLEACGPLILVETAPDSRRWSAAWLSGWRVPWQLKTRGTREAGNRAAKTVAPSSVNGQRCREADAESAVCVCWLDRQAFCMLSSLQACNRRLNVPKLKDTGGVDILRRWRRRRTHDDVCVARSGQIKLELVCRPLPPPVIGPCVRRYATDAGACVTPCATIIIMHTSFFEQPGGPPAGAAAGRMCCAVYKKRKKILDRTSTAIAQ